MNGTNNSTNFIDSSSAAHTMTAAGNAKMDTGTQKFGTASGVFDGNIATLLTTPDSTDFYVGAGDFTVDFWMKKNGDGLAYVLFGQWDSGTGTRSIEVTLSSDILQFNFWYGVGTFVQITAGSTLTGTAWHHIAFVRNGNTITGYLDGTSVGTGDVTGKTANDSPGVLGIGSLGNFTGADFVGWLDEFRFSKGIARWTANFTPPTVEYS